MAPILHYLLPAIGVCRIFPHTLVYATEKYMGLGVKPLHTVQEIAWIKDILSHVFQKSTTGKLYRSSFKMLLIELRMGPNIHLIPKEMLD